ncbi:MAG: magnesium/cobalt transporter CorA [Ignavibacteriaceae bacterium]|nr:magnesium/cobalt transporter CorA [Ignavibacteriaceae bacterium]
MKKTSAETRKKKIYRRSAKKPGLSPGTLIYTGDKKEEAIKISRFQYKDDSYEEKEFKSLIDCLNTIDDSYNFWINIDGIHNVGLVEDVGKSYGIHPLVLEDILNPVQRPKIEDYDEYIFIVLRMLTFNPKDQNIEWEQLSMIWGSNYLVTFQEAQGDVFEPVRERIRTGKGKIRKEGIDYLVYTLLDAVVDSYFSTLESIGDSIENLEDTLIENPSKLIQGSIHTLRRNLILIKKSVWPLREVLSTVLREEPELVKTSTRIYLRDVYDHSIQVIDTVESYRDILSGILETYLSSLSTKLNQVIKILTIISTIFIPLTFLSGVYGMNFKFMPELEIPWFYPWGFWGIIILLSGVMLTLFKKRKWL